jgi:hypothetical protein
MRSRCDAVELRAHNGGGVGEVRRSKRANMTTSLHALRYYRVALSLVLKRSKLWVKRWLHAR